MHRDLRSMMPDANGSLTPQGPHANQDRANTLIGQAFFGSNPPQLDFDGGDRFPGDAPARLGDFADQFSADTGNLAARSYVFSGRDYKPHTGMVTRNYVTDYLRTRTTSATAKDLTFDGDTPFDATTHPNSPIGPMNSGCASTGNIGPSPST